MREASARDGMRLRTGHGHPRTDRRSAQHALRHRGRSTRGPLAAPARQLSWLGLHARLRHRGSARERTGNPRGSARCAGIHLASALRRVSARQGTVAARPLFLGARGRKPEMTLRGLYAVTPEGPGLAEKVRLALQGGAAMLQYRNKLLSSNERLDE